MPNWHGGTIDRNPLIFQPTAISTLTDWFY